MSPYEIEIVLHHYASLAKFDRASAPLYMETVHGLVDQGLLTTDSRKESLSGVTATERGKAYVALLCSVEPPKQVWIDPRTGKVIDPAALGGKASPALRRWAEIREFPW